MTDKRFWHTAVAEGLSDRGCYCDPPGSGEEHCTGHCLLRAKVDYFRNALAESAGGKVDWIVRAERAEAEVGRLQGEVKRALDEPTQNEHDLWADNERLKRLYDDVYAENQRLEQALDMVAEEREAWKARALEEQAENDQWQKKVTDTWRELQALRVVIAMNAERCRMSPQDAPGDPPSS